jgi:hypothetical protein
VALERNGVADGVLRWPVDVAEILSAPGHAGYRIALVQPPGSVEMAARLAQLVGDTTRAREIVEQAHGAQELENIRASLQRLQKSRLTASEQQAQELVELRAAAAAHGWAPQGEPRPDEVAARLVEEVTSPARPEDEPPAPA